MVNELIELRNELNELINELMISLIH